MAEYNKILFPTDLSDGSKAIAKHVKLMADKFGAKIHILYVAHVGHYYSSLEVPTIGLASFEAEVMSAAEDKLNDFAKKQFSGMNIQTNVMAGNPSDEIIEYTEKNGIDLIIMGHSRAGLERVLLGSVAHRIVKLSPVPVMTVRINQ